VCYRKRNTSFEHAHCGYTTVLPELEEKHWDFLLLSCLSIFFSYPEAVTITGDKAANPDKCLSRMTFIKNGRLSRWGVCDSPVFCDFYAVFRRNCKRVFVMHQDSNGLFVS
jgi:hypothetical protein